MKERHNEPLEGEIKFPHIEIPISQTDLMELREYILVASGGFDPDSIEQQLQADFKKSHLGGYVALIVSQSHPIDPYRIAISLEQDNLKENVKIPFFDLLEIAYEVNEQLEAIYFQTDEGSKKFANDLHELFAGAPIISALRTELDRLKTQTEEKSVLNNAARFSEIQTDIKSLDRAVMIQQAVLIAINYH